MRLVRFGGAMSLDGYIAGPNGEYDWIVMDPEIDFGGHGAPVRHVPHRAQDVRRDEAHGQRREVHARHHQHRAVAHAAARRTTRACAIESDAARVVTELRAQPGQGHRHLRWRRAVSQPARRGPGRSRRDVADSGAARRRHSAAAATSGPSHPQAAGAAALPEDRHHRARIRNRPRLTCSWPQCQPRPIPGAWRRNQGRTGWCSVRGQSWYPVRGRDGRRRRHPAETTPR